MEKVIRIICVIVGFVFLALGAAGILVPVLPSTPFFLLTAACFARGSKRFHKWFTNTGVYRTYIQATIEKKEMTQKSKIKVLCTITIFFTAAFLVAPVWYARGVIGTILLLHYVYFLLRIKTTSESVEQEVHEEEKN